MAKEKTKVNDWPLTLERVMVEIKNNGQAVVDKEKAKADELNTKKAAILERLEYLKTL